MNKRLCLSAAMLVLASACATQTADLNPDPLADMPENWEAEAANASPISTGWLAAMDDPNLSALVAEALAANPDISKARGRLDRARALLGESRAAQVPSVSASSISQLTEGLDGGADDTLYAAKLTASWELDVWGRLGAATEASDYAAQSVAADFQSVRQLVAANTAQAYFALIEAERLAEVEQTNLASLEETLGFVSIQFERGLRSSEDIALIQADVETARASLDQAEQAQRDSARAIEILLGRYPAARLAFDGALPTLPESAAVGVPASMLERRPDIRAAKLSLFSEHARSESARADLLPRVSTQASFGGNVSTIEDLFDPSALAASFLLNGAQVLFDGGARKSRIAAADADREVALVAYQSRVLEAFNEVETELDRGAVLDRRDVYLTRALEEAEDALQFARFRYELGESDLLNVLSIQQRVASLQAALARTQRARLDQYVSLALALGQEI
ncbi:MAG: efflux transporter outer membrane subunit [Henriciella sp.]